MWEDTQTMANIIPPIANNPFEDTCKDDDAPIDLAGVANYAVCGASTHLVEYEGPDINNIDPEAHPMYGKPGIFIESRYRSAILGYNATHYDELLVAQRSESKYILYPFHSLPEYELV